MFHVKAVEKIRTHILCSVGFFFFEKRSIYENVEKCGRAREDTDGNIIRRMPFACWITEATPHTHTHTEYLILIAFPRQQCLHERISVLRYTYVECLVVVFFLSILLYNGEWFWGDLQWVSSETVLITRVSFSGYNTVIRCQHLSML